MEEWKSTYESYVSQWQAESAEARAKAESTRKRIEDELAAEQKAAAEASKTQQREARDKEEEAKRAERLRLELSAEGSRQKGRTVHVGKEERDKKVKEAWEMVKGSGEGSGEKEQVGDARGVMDEDVLAGNARPSGEEKPAVHQVSQVFDR